MYRNPNCKDADYDGVSVRSQLRVAHVKQPTLSRLQPRFLFTKYPALGLQSRSEGGARMWRRSPNEKSRYVAAQQAFNEGRFSYPAPNANLKSGQRPKAPVSSVCNLRRRGARSSKRGRVRPASRRDLQGHSRRRYLTDS